MYMIDFLSRIKKIISSFLIVAMCQMIISPVFLNQTYAAPSSIVIDSVILTLQNDANGSGANIGDTIRLDAVVSN